MEILNFLAGLTGETIGQPFFWVDFDLLIKTLPEETAICYAGFCGAKINAGGAEITLSTDAELQIMQDGRYNMVFNQNYLSQWFTIKFPNGEELESEADEVAEGLSHMAALIQAIPTLSLDLHQELLKVDVCKFVVGNASDIEWTHRKDSFTVEEATNLLKTAEIFPEINLDSFHEVVDDHQDGAVRFWMDGYLNAKLPYGSEFYSTCYVDFVLSADNVLTASIDSSSMDYYGDNDIVADINLILDGPDGELIRQRFDPEAEAAKYAELFKTLFLSQFEQGIQVEGNKIKLPLTADSLKKSDAWSAA